MEEYCLFNPSCRATSSELLEVVIYMLRKSENQPLFSLGTRETPLLIACKNSLYDIAMVLMEHSPKLLFISEARNNMTPLHIACSRGDTKMVELILKVIKTYIQSVDYDKEAKVNLDARDKEGCTPLYNACNCSSFEIVKLLVEFQRENRLRVSLNVNAAVKVSQRTPLHVAVRDGSLGIVKLLLTVRNIDINVEGHPSETTQNNLIQKYQEKMYSGPILTYQRNEDPEDVPVSQSNEARGFNTSLPINEPIPRCFTDLPIKPSSKEPTEPNIPVKDGNEQQVTKKRSQTNVHSMELGHSNLRIYEDPKTGQLDLYMKDSGKAISTEFDQLMMTPLAEACACSHTDIIKLLLLQGARDDSGLACRIAHLTKCPDLIRLILSYRTVLKKDLQVSEDVANLELNWSKLKLQNCERAWLGAEAEFYPLCKDHVQPLEDATKLINILKVSPEVTVQFNAVHAVHLNDNQLLSVPIELFQLQNVSKINMCNNKIAKLPLDSLGSSTWKCPKLTELNLSKNKLTHIPACVWCLPSLVSLLCSNNKLETLSPLEGPIRHDFLSASLKRVDVSSNSLKGTVSEFIFELPDLRQLNLGGNMITELPETLWGCESLLDIDVSRNHLRTLPFCGPENACSNPHSYNRPVPMLKADRMVVGRAEVKAPIGQGTLFDQETLSTIHALNTSQQVSVSTTTFNYSSLQKLNLSGNQFSEFPEALPCFAPNLTDLDISRNPLKDLDVQFLPLVLKKLTAKNCKLERVGNVITKSHQKQIIQNCRHHMSMGLACQHRAHTHLPYLAAIDLSNNQLTHMQLTRQQPADKYVNFGQLEKEYDHKITPALDLLYPTLEGLNLSSNNLKDTFNPNVGHQKNLQWIRLNDNRCLEKIPMEFAHLKTERHSKNTKQQLTLLHMENLPLLVDPPKEYQQVPLSHLLTYMRSRLKE